MATDTVYMNPPARHFAAPVVQYLRKDIDYTMNGQTVDVGTLPAGAVILKSISGVHVSTVFNGNATNTLDIGASTDTGTNNWATALALGVVTVVPFDEAVTQYVSVETKVQALVTSTASASAGAGQIIIAFVEDNDK